MKNKLRKIALFLGFMVATVSLISAVGVKAYAFEMNEGIALSEEMPEYYVEVDEDGTIVIRPVVDDEITGENINDAGFDVMPDGDGSYNVPGRPVWTDKEAAKLSFNLNNSNESVYYVGELQFNDRRTSMYHMGQLGKWEKEGIHYLDILDNIHETGTYKWRVKAAKDDNDNDFSTGAVSEFTEEWEYVRPTRELPTATNLRWSAAKPGVAQWDAVPGACRYLASLYKGKSFVVGLRQENTEVDFTKYIGDTSAESYTFSVRALSNYISTVANGKESKHSPALGNQDFTGAKEKIQETESNIYNAETKNEAEKAVTDLLNADGFDRDYYQLAMQVDPETRSAIDRLENEYTNKADISVNPPTVNADAQINGDVTIRGAALNALAGDSVDFNVKRADERDDRAIDTNVYKNVTRFDMDIVGAGRYNASTGELAFPVEVTMPVPDFIKNKTTAVILHYRHVTTNGEYDLIHPRFNNDGTMSFTVTHFSEIAVAEPVAAEIVVKQKYDVSSKFDQKCDKYEVSKETKKYASVTKAGIVTGQKPGTAVIVGYKKLPKNKWQEVGKTELLISLPTFKTKIAELTYPEATFDAAANIEGSSLKVTEWKSSKEAVATVDKATGLVTAKGKGAAKISAVYGEGKLKKEYSFNVKVNIPVQSKVSGKLLTGGTLKLKLTNTKKPITWTSTVSGNAIVDNKGQASLINAGDAEIVATVDGIDYKWNFKIEEPKIKGSDTINLDLKKKKKAKIALTNTKYKVTDVKWTISEDSDQGVISIDDKGNVTALKAGKVDVYTETGGVKNTYHITVAE